MAQYWLALTEQALKNSETSLVYETPHRKAPIVGENSIGMRLDWRTFQAVLKPIQESWPERSASQPRVCTGWRAGKL